MKIIHISLIPAFKSFNQKSYFYFVDIGLSAQSSGWSAFRSYFQTEAWFLTGSFLNKHQ